eukprot:6013867-Prymnesium_polylepis.2
MIVDIDSEIEAIAKTIRDACAARTSPNRAGTLARARRPPPPPRGIVVASRCPARRHGARALRAQVRQTLPRARLADHQPAGLRAGGAEAGQRD